METSRGRRGPNLSRVGLGGNNFGRPGSATQSLEGTRSVIDAAIEAGVTFIDTAEMYGTVPGESESLIGEALGARRSEVVLATKFGHAGSPMPELAGHAPGSRAYVRAAVEASLARLRTDWIDLYQQHTPDPSIPAAETAAALDELVAEGRIRWYGLSNYPADELRAAVAVGGWVSVQDEYSLINRAAEQELLPAVRELGLGFLPYYPLYNGLLTGKFRRDERPGDTRLARQKPELLDAAPWDALEAYAEFCAQRQVTMLEATFGWMLAQESVMSVIAGATRPEQVRANAAAALWHPTAEEVAAISAIFGGPVVGER